MSSGRDASVPEAALLSQQAGWLAPARGHLLRRVHIARRKRVLDLGSGTGSVMPELERRSGGSVIALDRSHAALATDPLRRSLHVAGDAVRLPFPDGTFDLIFSQITLLWVAPLADAIAEIWRGLTPGGVLVALEPDYGGMIEYPPEIAGRALWLAALERAGADPRVGRRLPGLLSTQGFDVQIGLFDTLGHADPARFSFLEGLPLTDGEAARLREIREAAQVLDGPWAEVAHLPFFLIRATKPEDPVVHREGARRPR